MRWPLTGSGSTRGTYATLVVVETSGEVQTPRTGCSRMEATGTSPSEGKSGDGASADEWEAAARALVSSRVDVWRGSASESFHQARRAVDGGGDLGAALDELAGDLEALAQTVRFVQGEVPGADPPPRLDELLTEEQMKELAERGGR